MHLDYSCSGNWNQIGLQEVSKLLRNLVASFLSAPETYKKTLLRLDMFSCKNCNKILVDGIVKPC